MFITGSDDRALALVGVKRLSSGYLTFKEVQKLRKALLLTLAAIFAISMLAGMMGCGEEEEEGKEPAKLLTTEPVSGGEMFANGSLLITFDSAVTEVKVNGIPANVIGTKAAWTGQGLQPGSQTLKIEWVDENGNTGSQDLIIIVDIADTTLPEVNQVSVKDGAADLDADELNSDGIVIKFSERIDTSKSKEAFALLLEGSPIAWTPEWSDGDTQVTLRPGPKTKLRPGSEYTLTIKGYFDGAGNEGSAVEITFATAGVNVPTEGLMLWLKADEGLTVKGSSVSAWADQSGNGTDAKQDSAAKQPVLEENAINGLPAVNFDGLDDDLAFTLPVNGLENLTIFVVSAATQAGVDPAWHYANRATIVWKEIGDWGTVHVTTLQEGVYIRFGTGQTQPLPVGIKYDAPIGDNFTIATGVMEGKRDRLYVKGELVYDEEKRAQTPVGNTGDIGYLGRGHEGNWPGKIAEVLVYTRTLPDNERELVEQYLSSKYSIR